MYKTIIVLIFLIVPFSSFSGEKKGAEVSKKIEAFIKKIDDMKEMTEAEWFKAAKLCRDQLLMSVVREEAITARNGMIWWLFNIFAILVLIFAFLFYKKMSADFKWSIKSLNKIQTQNALPNPVAVDFFTKRTLLYAALSLYMLMFLLINFVALFI